MSKEAGLRAMREARDAERKARTASAASGASGRAKPSKAPVAPPAPARARAEAVEPAADAPAVAGEALCGHRSMNGRSCTRELGHEAKNHRYS